jgi:hypothetical protein
MATMDFTTKSLTLGYAVGDGSWSRVNCQNKWTVGGFVVRCSGFEGWGLTRVEGGRHRG